MLNESKNYIYFNEMGKKGHKDISVYLYSVLSTIKYTLWKIALNIDH